MAVTSIVLVLSSPITILLAFRAVTASASEFGGELPDSFLILNQVELPILQANSNVKAIISEIDYKSAIISKNGFSPHY